MKPVVVFDTSLFAIPNTASSQEEVEALISSLIEWVDAIEKQDALLLCRDGDAVEILIEENCFPALYQARALLTLFELDHVFSPEDVSKTLTTILDRLLPLETAIGFQAMQLNNVTLSGFDLTRYPGERFKESSAKMAASASLWQRISPAANSMLGLVAKFLIKAPPVRISCIVETTTGVINITLPQPVAIEPQIFDSIKSYVRSLDPETVWSLSQTGSEIHFAIMLAALADLRTDNDQVTASDVPNFLVGERFIESLETNLALIGSTSARVTLSRCVQVLLNKAVKISKFGSIRSSDNASARRVHIGKSGEALRLMLWSLSDGRLEFANIGPKHQLLIQQGNPDLASACRICDSMC